MFMGKYLICLTTHDKVYHIVGTEILLDGNNRIQDNHQLVFRLYLGLGMQTVVAVMTVVLLMGLSEIMQQHLATAHRGLCISCRLLQQLSADILFCDRLSLHELVEFLEIFIRIEGDTQSLSPISTGTSSLLIISFQGLRNVIMDDKADIRFVNTHTESDGGNDDIYLLHQEVVLCLGAECRVKTRMIRLCLDIIGTQYLRQFLYLFTGETVDNTALPRVLLDKLNDILVNILGFRTYLIIQVRTIE